MITFSERELNDQNPFGKEYNLMNLEVRISKIIVVFDNLFALAERAQCQRNYRIFF